MVVEKEKLQIDEELYLLKQYLSQYYSGRKRKQQLERRLREVNAELKSPIGGLNYSPVPRSETNKIGPGAASILYRMAEIEERIIKQKDNVEYALLRVMDMMDFLPENSTERMILELRYIDCRPWQQIVKEVSLTRTPCNKYYNNGLDMLLKFKKVKTMLEKYKEDKEVGKVYSK